MDSFLDIFLRWWRYRNVVKYITRDSIVCDIGCGNDRYFLKKISDRITYGIGLDKDVDDYRDSKYELKKIEVFESIPLASESCDIVVMMAVLEHLSEPRGILKESFRILKKGGTLILTTPLPVTKPLLEFLAFRMRMIDRKEINDHKNYFWPSDIEKMLLEVSFSKDKIKKFLFECFLNNLIIAQK